MSHRQRKFPHYVPHYVSAGQRFVNRTRRYRTLTRPNSLISASGFESLMAHPYVCGLPPSGIDSPAGGQ